MLIVLKIHDLTTHPSAGLDNAISSMTSLGSEERVSFKLSYSDSPLPLLSGWVTVKARESRSSELGRALQPDMKSSVA